MEKQNPSWPLEGVKQEPTMETEFNDEYVKYELFKREIEEKDDDDDDEDVDLETKLSHVRELKTGANGFQNDKRDANIAELCSHQNIRHDHNYNITVQYSAISGYSKENESVSSVQQANRRYDSSHTHESSTHLTNEITGTVFFLAS